MRRASEGRRAIYVLTGCTAVGKTELSLQWAERRGAEIVSCDSTLFYRGMDIGTAKPTWEDRRRAPHHLIDILELHERMDVGRYVNLAIERARDIWSRGKDVLVTGGSGFYLQAFFRPVVDQVEVGEEVRRRVAKLQQEEGLEGLQRALKEADPGGARSLDIDNPRRVARALERCWATGMGVLELKREYESGSNFLTEQPKVLTRLSRSRQALNERIARRVREMLASGLVEEVKALRERGLEAYPQASSAIGYRETLACLRGEMDWSELEGAIATSTRRLAKKQRTWFRGQLPKHRVIDLDEGEPDLDELFG